MKTISAASAWLSGAVLLSLLGAIGGGLLGARAARRALGTAYVEKRRSPASEVSPRTVARPE